MKVKMNIEEIKRLAFLKYRLSGKRSMNTFIFTQARNNKLTDDEIEKILTFLERKIKKYESSKLEKISTNEEIEVIIGGKAC